MRLGLVLSGGGASGVGHIPVLQALDDLGIRPVAISGTSIGAMIGAMYAAGMTGDQIRAHFLDMGGRPVSKMWKIAMQGALGINRGLVAVDAESFTQSFFPDIVPATFEDLPIQLFATAVDYYARTTANFSTGDLQSAVACSIAIPGVFKPVIRDGRVYVDGGLIENLPLQYLPPVDLTLAVDIYTDPPSDDTRIPSQVEAAQAAARLMMAKHMAWALEKHPPDILIRPNIVSTGFSTLWKIEDVLTGADHARSETRAVLEKHLS